MEDMENVNELTYTYLLWISPCFMSFTQTNIYMFFYSKTLVGLVPQFIPTHLICPLTKKMFVDPVKTVYGSVYERKAIEEHLKQWVNLLKMSCLYSYSNDWYPCRNHAVACDSFVNGLIGCIAMYFQSTIRSFADTSTIRPLVQDTSLKWVTSKPTRTWRKWWWISVLVKFSLRLQLSSFTSYSELLQVVCLWFILACYLFCHLVKVRAVCF